MPQCLGAGSVNAAVSAFQRGEVASVESWPGALSEDVSPVVSDALCQRLHVSCYLIRIRWCVLQQMYYNLY